MNFGSGYFSVLIYAGAVIILAVEGWWFWNAADEMSSLELFFSEAAVAGGLIIVCLSFNSEGRFLPAIILPFLVNFLAGKAVKRLERAADEKSAEQELRNWLYTIEIQPDNVNAYAAAGDIYFKKGDYKNAAVYYRRGVEIHAYPWIAHKLKTAENEAALQEGTVWRCQECGKDNPPEAKTCRFCKEPRRDAPRSLKSILQAVKTDKEPLRETLRLLFITAGIFTGLTLGVWLLVWLALLLKKAGGIYLDLFALVVSLSVLLILLKMFINW